MQMSGAILKSRSLSLQTFPNSQTTKNIKLSFPARLLCSTSTIAALLHVDPYRRVPSPEALCTAFSRKLMAIVSHKSLRKCDVAIISRFSFHSILESTWLHSVAGKPLDWSKKHFLIGLAYLKPCPSGASLYLPGNILGKNESWLLSTLVQALLNPTKSK